jgi:hypothetical protein
MNRAYTTFKKILVFVSIFALWSLVFVNEAPAPELPPPPTGSASGMIAQIAAIAVIGAYGAFRLLRKK